MKISISSPVFKNEDSIVAFSKVMIGENEQKIELNFEDTKIVLHYSEFLKQMIDSKLIDPITTFSALKTEYMDMLESVEEIHLARKKARYAREYQNLWHVGMTFPTFDGVTYIQESEEEYVESKLKNNWHQGKVLEVRYKGQKVSVDRTDVSNRSFRNRTSRNIKFQVCSTITDYNRRNYSTLENAVKSIIKLTDKLEASETYKVEYEAKVKQQRKETAQKLAAALKVDVTTVRTYKVPSKTWHKEGYYVYSYSIEVAGKKLDVSFSDSDDNVVNIAGIKGITVDQALMVIAAIS